MVFCYAVRPGTLLTQNLAVYFARLAFIRLMSFVALDDLKYRHCSAAVIANTVYYDLLLLEGPYIYQNGLLR